MVRTVMINNDQSLEAGRRQYYSSSQGPFYNASNIYMFYGGGNRGKVAESVIQAIRGQESIVHVHGEAGSGKTMMSLVISDRIKHRFNTIRYDLHELSASKLLRHLLIELAPQDSDLISSDQAQYGADPASIERAIQCIEKQLGKSFRTRDSKPYVLLIDSKEALGAGALEVAQRLSACKSANECVFHCVIFHTTASSAERYAAVSETPYQSENHFWLRRLTLSEISEYLRHHMMLFDFNRRDLFTREMAYFIADRSEGVFNSIDTLARNAFTIASLEEADKLSMSHLLMAGLPIANDSAYNNGLTVKYRKTTVCLLGLCSLLSMTLAILWLG